MKKRFHSKGPIVIDQTFDTQLLHYINFAEECIKAPLTTRRLVNLAWCVIGTAQRKRRDTNLSIKQLEKQYIRLVTESRQVAIATYLCDIMRKIEGDRSMVMRVKTNKTCVKLDKVFKGGLITLTIGGISDDIEENNPRSIVAGYSESVWQFGKVSNIMMQIAKGVLCYGGLLGQDK